MVTSNPEASTQEGWWVMAAPLRAIREPARSELLQPLCRFDSPTAVAPAGASDHRSTEPFPLSTRDIRRDAAETTRPGARLPVSLVSPWSRCPLSACLRVPAWSRHARDHSGQLDVQRVQILRAAQETMPKPANPARPSSLSFSRGHVIVGHLLRGRRKRAGTLCGSGVQATQRGRCPRGRAGSAGARYTSSSSASS